MGWAAQASLTLMGLGLADGDDEDDDATTAEDAMIATEEERATCGDTLAALVVAAELAATEELVRAAELAAMEELVRAAELVDTPRTASFLVDEVFLVVEEVFLVVEEIFLVVVCIDEVFADV